MPTKTKLAYLYIRAWGRLMGSHQYYINDQIDKALSENAPEDAIFRDVDKPVWHRHSEMKDTNPNKAEVQRLVDQIKQASSKE